VDNSGVIVGNHLSDKSFGFIYENGVFRNIVYSGANYTMAGGHQQQPPDLWRDLPHG
jgi:hypothetical protein